MKNSASKPLFFSVLKSRAEVAFKNGASWANELLFSARDCITMTCQIKQDSIQKNHSAETHLSPNNNLPPSLKLPRCLSCSNHRNRHYAWRMLGAGNTLPHVTLKSGCIWYAHSFSPQPIISTAKSLCGRGTLKALKNKKNFSRRLCPLQVLPGTLMMQWNFVPLTFHAVLWKISTSTSTTKHMSRARNFYQTKTKTCTRTRTSCRPMLCHSKRSFHCTGMLNMLVSVPTAGGGHCQVTDSVCLADTKKPDTQVKFCDHYLIKQCDKISNSVV